MQFRHAHEQYLQELLLDDPAQGPLYMLKLDISDGFYRIAIAPNNIPKLGVIFPHRPHQEQLVALPLVLPMGWKILPPVFSAATETAADIANTILTSNHPFPLHPLESYAAIYDQDPASISTE